MSDRCRMTAEEKYYFDLRGYLVVRDVLTAEETAGCNAAIDRFAGQMTERSVEGGGLARDSQALRGNRGRGELTGMLGWPAPWREPFRRLLVHPVVVSRLNEISGRGFRLDHGPTLIAAAPGTEGHALHGAGEPFAPVVPFPLQESAAVADVRFLCFPRVPLQLELGLDPVEDGDLAVGDVSDSGA